MKLGDIEKIYLYNKTKNIEGEFFLDIEEYEGLYQISNYGRIKSLNFRGLGLEGIRKQQVDKDGYLRCTLTKNLNNKCFIIHQLVGKHFLDLVKGKPHINHIDGNKLNNIFSNLEWCNISENNDLAFKMGLLSKGGRIAKCIIMEDDLGNIKKFASAKNAIVQLNLKKSSYHSIISCCNGKQNKFNNCKWSYSNQDETKKNCMIEDTSKRVLKYSNAIQRKFKNKKVTLADLKDGSYQLEIINLDKEFANEPCVVHKTEKGVIRMSGLCMSKETLVAFVLNAIDLLNEEV